MGNKRKVIFVSLYCSAALIEPMTVPMEESSEITSGEEELNSMLSPCTECVENSTKRNNKVLVAFGEKANL